MKKGQFVLENKAGEVVRVFRWQQGSLHLIRRNDTGRVETHASLQDLKKRKIEFDTIAELSKRETQAQPLKLANGSTIRWVPQVTNIAPSIPLKQDGNEEYKAILKWTSIVHVAALIIVLGLGHFFLNREVIEEARVVKVFEQKLPKVKRQTIKAAKKKVVKKRRNRKAKIANKTRNVVNRKRKVRTAKKTKQVSGLGALGALNGAKSKTRRNGLKLAQAGSSPSKSRSGRGYNRSLVSKGLVASAPGRGGKVRNIGTYKTRGAGNGQGGYGKIRISGAKGSYLQPLQSEALIEGGLGRDQIAAVIQRNIGQVVYCYEKGLQTKPKLSGRVAVRFIISGNGRVSLAKVANSSLRAQKVEGCIVGKLKNWKFPKPVGNVNVKVTYPFVLRRVSQG